MPRYNPVNEVVKKQYEDALLHGKYRDEKTVRAVWNHINRFEEFTGYADFKTFNAEQAKSFKHWLEKQKNKKGELLSISTVRSTLNSVREFFSWLAIHPNYVKKVDGRAVAPVQIAGEAGFTASSKDVEVNISGNVQRIMDLEELDEWDVPDRFKVIIAQGSHPDMPKEGDNSRSAWVFDCVCNLVRCDVPDEVIFSIITDPDWAIAKSIVEMKSNAEKYAIRQIARAKEWVIDPMLVKLNEKFAVVGNIGGKCRIVEEVMDHGLDRMRLCKMQNLCFKTLAVKFHFH